jgi:hypothetical protein
VIHFDQGRLRLEIDPRTGSIVTIADTVSGTVHFEASPRRGTGQPRAGAPGREGGAGRLFRAIVPIERWSSRAADSWGSGPPDIEAASDRIVLRYDGLRAAGAEAHVQAEVHIARGGPSEALLTLRLRCHRGDGDVTDVLFPWLCGWRPGESPAAAVTLGGVRSVAPATFPVNRGMTFSRWHQREYFAYPTEMYAPWVDASGAEGGMGLISYQRTARNIGSFIENLAGYDEGLDLSIGFNHYLELGGGMTWESPPVGISVHDGDWHGTADRYSAWVDTWFRPPPTPQWARRTIGFQNVLFRGFDGTPIRALESMPEVAAAGVQAGVPHLSVWDYVLLGEYGKLDDVPLHGFAGRDRVVLRNAIAASRRAGARLSSLQNYRLVKPTSRLYANGADAEVCRRYDGAPFVEEYCGSLAHAMVITSHVGPMVHPVDARIPSVRNRVLDLIEDSLDLGFDSHFYDQPFENWPSYHPDRGDDGPDGAHAGTVDLLRAVRDRIEARGRDGIMIGEYCDVFASEAIDLWMSWYTDFDDLRRSAYAIPQTIQSWVVDDDVAAATRAFVIGAQLCLTTRGGEGHLGDVPEFARHVAMLAALRDREPGLWGGRFRDQAGFHLDGDGPILGASFAGPAGPLLVVGSPGGPGRAVLDLDIDHLKPAAAAMHLVRLDGRVGEVTGSRVDIRLAENEVAILRA